MNEDEHAALKKLAEQYPYNHPAWDAVQDCYRKSTWQHHYLTFLLLTRLKGWKLVPDDQA